MDSGCVFCRIVKDSVSAYKVYEDERVLAFLDIHPSAPAHTLLIPKAHLVRLEDLSEGDSLALFKALHKLVSKVQKAAGSEASTIGINNGPDSGQEIPHLHIHIIPRFRNDHGGVVQSLGRKGFHYGDGEMQEIAEKIKTFVVQNP